MQTTLALVLSILVTALTAVPAVSLPADPDGPGSGALLCRQGDALVPMPLLSMDVTIEVTGILSRARLTQQFENPSETVMEAVYVFPLPERAAIRHMEIRIGDRRIVSRVQEKQQARETYVAAKSEGKKAALVEQERPNLFTTSVANINPGERVDVILEYVEEIAYENGRFGVDFPLTFTPRYIPDSRWTRDEAVNRLILVSSIVPDAQRIAPPFRHAADPGAPRASFRVLIRGGVPVTDVRCLSHLAPVSRHDDTWLLSSPGTVRADRDIRVEWSPAVGTGPEAACFVETQGDATYGLLMLIPPVSDAVSPDAGLPTRTLFVLDVSGSMAGPSITQAKLALGRALGRLRPQDRFNILAFNNDSRLYEHSWSSADPLEIARARGWVRALEANGGTEIHAALLRSLSLFDAGEVGELSRIVFLTDGSVGNEAQILAEVASGLGSIRIHAVGIGHAPNGYFVRKLAETGSGLSTFVFDTALAESAIDAFLTRIERPILGGLELELPGATRVDAYPPRLPDLHRGDPLFVSLRWDGPAPTSLTVRGLAADAPYEVTVRPRERTEGGLSVRWARARVEDLMDRRFLGDDPETIRHAVIQVGLDHHLVTEFTSLVAVEERVTAEGAARTATVANALPLGSELLGALPQGGTLGRLRLLVAAGFLAAGFGLLIAVRRGGFGATAL